MIPKDFGGLLENMYLHRNLHQKTKQAYYYMIVIIVIRRRSDRTYK